MIEVKALRPTQDRTVSPEETYRKVDNEPAPSRWPAALTVIVLAVAAYLRSLVGAEANPQAEQPEPDQLASAAPEPGAGEIEPDPEDETGSLPGKKAAPEADPDGNLGSGAAAGPIPGLADFLGIDSPPIDYEQLPLPAFVKAAFEFGLGRVSNDNGFALASQIGGSSLSLSRSDASGLQLTSPIVVAPFKPVVVVPPPRDDEPGDPVDPVDPVDPRSRNRAPRLAGAVQLGEIGPCQTLMLTLAGLLVGASDADGDTLAIRNLQVSSGTITLAEGGWQYKPMAGYFGPVTVSYAVTDGIASVTQTATFNVVEVLVLDGTEGDDVLTGTDCADLIQGGAGNDGIDARGGRDVVQGGDGDDTIQGGDGDDTLHGGAGNDTIHGGTGADILFGGLGNDRLYGDDGDDTLAGEAGDDHLDGGAGNDTLDGGAGNDEVKGGDGDDVIQAGEGDDHVEGNAGDDIVDAGAGDDTVDGGDGDDTLLGGSGEDVLKGGAGDDTLDGGEGSDTVTAGAGDDTVIASPDAAADCLDGGSGDDTLDLSDTTSGVCVDLTQNKAVGIEIGSDTVLDFEALIGGDGDDRFIAGNSATTITGGQGDDRFEFHVPEEAQSALIHQILDLEEGDRIVVKQYEIHSDAAAGGTEIDPFGETYSDTGEAGRPFRFRIEKVGEEERTYVDVLVTQQEATDFSIEIYGNHKLYYYSY